MDACDAALSPRDRFARISRTPDGQIDLAEAALLIAAEEYPQLSVGAYLSRLDDLARDAAPVVGGGGSTRARVEQLNRFLFVERGFAGNRDDYYDPRNSFLNDVIETRRGIPITLAVVFIAVASRLGLDARGVSFPGHFLVKVVGGEMLLVDAFHGAILDEAGCRARLRRVMGSDADFEPRIHLRAASAREVLVRMLSNLKQIHLRKSDFGRALGCCERILLLFPEAPVELRDRGLVYERLECFAAALRDFQCFLKLAPDDASAPAIRAKILSLQQKTPRLH